MSRCSNAEDSLLGLPRIHLLLVSSHRLLHHLTNRDSPHWSPYRLDLVTIQSVSGDRDSHELGTSHFYSSSGFTHRNESLYMFSILCDGDGEAREKQLFAGVSNQVPTRHIVKCQGIEASDCMAKLLLDFAPSA